jgi:hypothetical protein
MDTVRLSSPISRAEDNTRSPVSRGQIRQATAAIVFLFERKWMSDFLDNHFYAAVPEGDM